MAYLDEKPYATGHLLSAKLKIASLAYCRKLVCLWCVSGEASSEILSVLFPGVSDEQEGKLDASTNANSSPFVAVSEEGTLVKSPSPEVHYL